MRRLSTLATLTAVLALFAAGWLLPNFPLLLVRSR